MARRLMASTVRVGLAAVPLLAMACGAPESSGMAPSSLPRSYLLAVHETGVRVFELGQDGRLTAAALGDVILPVTLTPGGPFVDLARRLVYLADRGRGFLAAYRLDPSTGALTLFDQVKVPQEELGNAAVDPGGRFLYTTASGSAFGYRIDTRAGLGLEPIPGSPFTTSEDHGYPLLGSFEFSPSGRFVWLHAQERSGVLGYPRTTREMLLSFRVNPASGALESTGGLEVKVWDRERSNLAAVPGERLAFLGRRESLQLAPSLTRYAIDPVSGVLAEEGRLRGIFTDRLHMTPSGRWLLAANIGAATLYTLEVQPQGDVVLRNSLDLPVEGQRPIAQHGPYVYVGLSWNVAGYFQGSRLAVLRLDEDSGALETIQEVQIPGRRIASLALAELAP